jgi:hypothetical protein
MKKPPIGWLGWLGMGVGMGALVVLGLWVTRGFGDQREETTTSGVSTSSEITTSSEATTTSSEATTTSIYDCRSAPPATTPPTTADVGTGGAVQPPDTTAPPPGGPPVPADHWSCPQCLWCHQYWPGGVPSTLPGPAPGPALPSAPDHSDLADDPAVCAGCHPAG